MNDRKIINANQRTKERAKKGKKEDHVTRPKEPIKGEEIPYPMLIKRLKL